MRGESDEAEPPAAPEAKRQKFKKAADAAVDASRSPHPAVSRGSDDGSGRKRLQASWMGASLSRKEVPRQQVRIACDQHRRWRKEHREQQVREEASQKAAEEEKKAAKMQAIRALAQKNEARGSALGAGSSGSQGKEPQGRWLRRSRRKAQERSLKKVGRRSQRWGPERRRGQ